MRRGGFVAPPCFGLRGIAQRQSEISPGSLGFASTAVAAPPGVLLSLVRAVLGVPGTPLSEEAYANIYSFNNRIILVKYSVI